MKAEYVELIALALILFPAAGLWAMAAVVWERWQGMRRGVDWRSEK